MTRSLKRNKNKSRKMRYTRGGAKKTRGYYSKKSRKTRGRKIRKTRRKRGGSSCTFKGSTNTFGDDEHYKTYKDSKKKCKKILRAIPKNEDEKKIINNSYLLCKGNALKQLHLSRVNNVKGDLNKRSCLKKKCDKELKLLINRSNGQSTLDMGESYFKLENLSCEPRARDKLYSYN